MEVDANRQARNDYVAEVERLEECGRGIWEILENPDNTELWSSDIPQEIGLKAAFECEGSFDGSVHSIPSRGECLHPLLCCPDCKQNKDVNFDPTTRLVQRTTIA